MNILGMAFALVGTLFLGTIGVIICSNMIEEFKRKQFFDGLTSMTHAMACLFFIVIFWKLVVGG